MRQATTLVSCFSLVVAVGLWAQTAVFVGAASPAPVAETGIYGTPWSAISLSNLEVGRFKGRMVSYRFRAEETGEFRMAKVFFVFAILGPKEYADGDGGQVKIELRPDDGTANHFPNMQAASLSSVLVADPLNKTKGPPIWGADSHRSTDPRAGASFPEIQFPPATLQKGRLYHLVFSNPTADPTNYTSLDLLQEKRSQPGASDLDFCCLFKPVDAKPWAAIHSTPILEIHYADGRIQGQGYMDVAASHPSAIAGASAVRTTLKVSGGNKRVTKVFFCISRKPDAGDLVVRLEKGNGTEIEEGIVPAAALASALGTAAAGQSAPMNWASYTFKQPRTLTDGQTYHLVLKSPNGGGYTTYPIEFGNGWGFAAGNFKDGCFEQTADGKTWQKQSGNPSWKQELYFVTVKTP